MSEKLPLSPAVFSILLALADGEKHGYAIMKESAAQVPSTKMGPGTLYGSLDRMVAAGLAEETGTTDDQRRRYYRMTRAGREALTQEATRLRSALSALRRKGVYPEVTI
jgi:DNA-binding PadR family transcriptional regulator